ncbi:MAG: MBL fold metallo-hydrolase [Acidobacteriota bacterium]
MPPLPPGLHFLERGWFSANHVLLTGGEGPALVDTGHFRDLEATEAALRSAGVHPEELQVIVNTHCHADHWGGDRHLLERSGADFACGEDTADLFTRRDLRAMWLDYFGGEGRYYDLDQLPPKIHRTFTPGETVELGAFRFEVLAAPGHAPDSIALFEREHAVLISADALMEGDCGVLNVAVHGEGVVEQALDTVARFRGLGATVALPGHGPPIADVDGSLDALERRLLEFQRRPDKLARHLVARCIVTSLMAMQPMARGPVLDALAAGQWARDYAPRLGFEPGALVSRTLAELEGRGVVGEDADGLLVAHVRR